MSREAKTEKFLSKDEQRRKSRRKKEGKLGGKITSEWMKAPSHNWPSPEELVILKAEESCCSPSSFFPFEEIKREKVDRKIFGEREKKVEDRKIFGER